MDSGGTGYNSLGLLQYVIPVIGAIVGAVYYFYDKARKAKIADHAETMGWSFNPRPDRGLAASLHGDPFNFGTNRRAENVTRGKSGASGDHSFVAFDYMCETRVYNPRGPDQVIEHRYGVVAIRATAPFPQLSVKPEGALSRAKGALTNSDIDFEDEDFNRAFVVESEDRKFAYDVMNPRMMEWLKSEAPDLRWRFGDNRIYVISDRTIQVEHINRAVRTLERIASLIPDFVIADCRQRNGMDTTDLTTRPGAHQVAPMRRRKGIYREGITIDGTKTPEPPAPVAPEPRLDGVYQEGVPRHSAGREPSQARAPLSFDDLDIAR